MYFSDREKGPRPRTNEEISADAWGGILALLQSFIGNDFFAIEFSSECPDGLGVSGTDKRALAYAIRAEIPDLDWPTDIRELPWSLDVSQPPTTLAILDLLEFCYGHVGKPIRLSFHSFFGHHHLSFDRKAGQDDFRQRVGRILARSGLAYELQEDGRIIRLAPPTLHGLLQSSVFQTGDAHLDAMLESARTKFLNPDRTVRRESLEKLWDAWERLKTLKDPDKKKSIAILLDKASPEASFRQRLDSEATELTSIGNNFMIRHTETGKVPIASSEQVDYLFQRMFASVYLLLKAL